MESFIIYMGYEWNVSKEKDGTYLWVAKVEAGNEYGI
jgi:hypothetical protein